MELGDRLDELVGTQLLTFGDVIRSVASVLIESCENEEPVLVVLAGRWFGRSVIRSVLIVGHHASLVPFSYMKVRLQEDSSPLILEERISPAGSCAVFRQRILELLTLPNAIHELLC